MVTEQPIFASRILRQRRGRVVAVGLIAALAMVVILFLWQGRDSDSTAIAGGDIGAIFGDGPCAVEPLLDVLRAGIPTYDYEPAGSYAALADSAAAVVSGTIASIERVETNGRSFIELSVTDVVDARTSAPRGDIAIVAYDAVWADRSQPDPISDPVSLSDARFVGFLSPWSGVRGGWAPGVEGLYIACSDDEPARAVIADAAGLDDPPNQSVTGLTGRPES